jgi:hypothetical protein
MPVGIESRFIMSTFKNVVLTTLDNINHNIARLCNIITADKMKSPAQRATTACGPEPYVFPPLYNITERKDGPSVSPGTVSPYAGLVECEVCGCLLKKETARKGEAEIRLKKTAPTQIEGYHENEEYIYHPYFCNVCCECDICEDYCEEEEQVGTGNDSVFFGLGTPEILGNSNPFAPAVDKNSADEQLKRAQRDYFLGQAELLRAQAEAVKFDTKTKKGGS